MRQSKGFNGLAGVRPAVIGMGRILGMGISAVAAHPLNSRGAHGHEPEETGYPLWVLYVSSMTLVLLGGAFAGLTIA